MRFLPAAVVHAGLAADAGVDHRQQRGRHLHERHAAQDREAAAKPVMSPINAAAERDDRRFERSHRARRESAS